MPESKRDCSEWRKFDKQLNWDVAEIKDVNSCFQFFGPGKKSFLPTLWTKELTADANYFSKLVTACKQRKRKSPGIPLKESKETIRNCGFSQLHHPPYSSDERKYFDTGEELNMFVNEYLHSLDETFFATTFDELVARWRKMVINKRDYIDN